MEREYRISLSTKSLPAGTVTFSLHNGALPGHASLGMKASLKLQGATASSGGTTGGTTTGDTSGEAWG